MTDRQTKRELPKRDGVPILNPRYAGATLEAVGRALLRHDPESDDGEAEDKPSDIIDQPAIQSRI